MSFNKFWFADFTQNKGIKSVVTTNKTTKFHTWMEKYIGAIKLSKTGS